MERFTLQDMRTYLIVGNITNEIHDTLSGDFSLAYAKREAKQCSEYHGEPCRLVRAVCDPISDDCPWCCGSTFSQAEANYRKGISDNWADF
jgi:hypothetical protein